jgi:hypothetical protein
MMPAPAQLELARRLVAGFHRPLASERLRGATVPFSAVVAIARAALEEGAFFPPGLRPEDLGDGALIERRGRHRLVVHERGEAGQLRYTAPRARSFFFLRRAVARYLRHYRALLRADGVRVPRWG